MNLKQGPSKFVLFGRLKFSATEFHIEFLCPYHGSEASRGPDSQRMIFEFHLRAARNEAYRDCHAVGESKIIFSSSFQVQRFAWESDLKFLPSFNVSHWNQIWESDLGANTDTLACSQVSPYCHCISGYAMQTHFKLNLSLA